MVQMSIHYQGKKRCKATHGPSGNSFITDAPKDNNGLGESFSPTDLLATALGTCMITVIGIHCDKMSWNFEGAQAEIEKHMQTSPRKVSLLKCSVLMPKSLTSDQRAVLEEIALHCPVKLSLNPDIQIPIEFKYL